MASAGTQTDVQKHKTRVWLVGGVHNVLAENVNKLASIQTATDGHERRCTHGRARMIKQSRFLMSEVKRIDNGGRRGHGQGFMRRVGQK
jgi:hypothetical protein